MRAAALGALAGRALVAAALPCAAQMQPADAIAGHWKSDAQFVARTAVPSIPSYFWVGAVSVTIAPTGRLSLSAANGCRASGLLAPVGSLRGNWRGTLSLTGCRSGALNRTYDVTAASAAGFANLRLAGDAKVVEAGKLSAAYELRTTLARR